MAHKYVYFFGNGKAEGNAQMKVLLGGKGANLAEMTNLGIPVPPGFTITTEVCTYFYKHGETYPPELLEHVEEALRKVEYIMGKKFGDPSNPLLVSVRSGAPASMPGMMDTVLNLGLNDETVKGLAELTKDERFAYDCYRRFVAMYGDVVLGLKAVGRDDIDPFEAVLEEVKHRKGVVHDNELDSESLKEIVKLYKELIYERLGIQFPEDPEEQLWGAIGAVFRSWQNPRAIAYRRINDIPDDMGTAVNVQAMVFGNMGLNSATGVAFTRNPSTGENVLYGEYLVNAQGEDVVAGIRTPQPINKAQKTDPNSVSLEEAMPDVYVELERIRKLLDRHYKDMQDIEFTIECGKLWMLQTRSGKRTAFAALRIAVEMVEEGILKEEEAVMRVEPQQLTQLLRPTFDSKAKEKAISNGALLAKGLNAGPGAATGRVVFNAPDAEEWVSRGEQVILVRIETSPEDIRGMHAAQGILTSRGGMTSHAALVARQMGRVCIVGCGAIEIDYKKRQFSVNGRVIHEGDWISLDGTTGEVLEGKLLTQPSDIVRVVIDKTLKPEDSIVYRNYAKIMEWADQYRRIGIRTNADKPDQATVALAFGAEGIGLCRTEHMFFEGRRIDAVREMILADYKDGRERALAKLLPMQKEDFKGIFRVMKGLPVTIRTLDPPLHEFLPADEKTAAELAETMGVSFDRLWSKIQSLHEANPMLGHRGCRLGIVYPEITVMQSRAIFEAACEVQKEGIPVRPEVMIPLVGHVKELEDQKRVVDEVACEVFQEQGVNVVYSVGTMIEIPRGAITADQIAKVAEFFSFGTNDLTQTVFGISRDDAARFLHQYLEKGIWEHDPFEMIDFEGVGELMRIGVKKGRSTRADLKVGICGEHGGEPHSIEFCHQIGLDYVSCSSYRVPIARLAAAQAAIREKRNAS